MIIIIILVIIIIIIIIVIIIAFDEGESKPNFDQWLSRVGCPVAIIG